MALTYGDEITKNFSEHLAQLGYSKGSRYMLPRLVSAFLSYHNIISLETITRQDIQSFYDNLQIAPNKRYEGGLSEIYIYHHIYALKVFFGYLEAIGQIKYNPISAMKFKKPEYNKRQPLTQEEITLLFDNALTLRETAMLHLFYSCGLRRSEAESLNIRDVHFKNRLLYVREGKGAKRRVIPITERVSKDLESYYIYERTSGKVKDDESFILNQVGNRQSGDCYNKELKTILKRAEITKQVTLHHLRHSIATHLLENGLSIEYVRDFLGHSYLEATQIYTKVNKYQLKRLWNH